MHFQCLLENYRRDFVIFEANKGPQTKICNGYGETIYLFYSPETKHFDAVYTKDFINSSSFCQCKSIFLLKVFENKYIFLLSLIKFQPTLNEIVSFS